MKYSHNSLDSILSCFTKHKVEISFNEGKDIKNALDEIIHLSARIFLEENVKNLYNYKTIEYNLTKKQPISYVKWYSYGVSSIFAGNRVINQMNDIQSHFNTLIGLFDMRGFYGLVSSNTSKVVDSFLHRLNPGNLSSSSEEYFVNLLNEINLPYFLNEIRNQNINEFWLFSIGMDYQGILNSIAFRCNLKKLLNTNFFKVNEKCDKIEEIKKFISSNILDGDEAALGFDMRSNSFYIEIFPDDCDVFLSNIKKYFPFDSNYLDSINVNLYLNHSFKFLWDKNGNLNLTITKVYENPRIS
jgi:hypothetical protein